MSEPRPLRRPPSDEEIAERLNRCYPILYKAGLRAQQRRAAEAQQPALHLVVPADDPLYAPSPEPPCPESAPLGQRRAGEGSGQS